MIMPTFGAISLVLHLTWMFPSYLCLTNLKEAEQGEQRQDVPSGGVDPRPRGVLTRHGPVVRQERRVGR